MDAMKKAFTIAASGTTGDIPTQAGYRLVGLMIPTADSTTLAASLYIDEVANAKVAVDAAGAAITIGGTAQTWNKFVPVPETLSLMAMACAGVRLTVASQTSGALSCMAFFVRDV